MAGKSGLQTMEVHSRSISLPARLHPNSLDIEAELNKLRTHEESPWGAESIQTGLIRHAELYNSTKDVISSSCTQQALHKQKHVKLVEEALDRSVGLLDACGNARELILNVKDQVIEIQSALRTRAGGDYSSMESKIHACMSFRKESKKDIAKCLRELKRINCNAKSFCRVELDHEQTFMATNVLRESITITISIFRSILLFLSMPLMKTKAASGWSLIKRLIPAATETSQQISSEVGSVDIAFYILHGQIRKSDAKIDVQIVLRRLETLDATIRDLETGLDRLFRQLIEHRVSLLNILTP